MDVHDRYMQRCIELARLGLGHVAPNPMVGAIIVHENKIIGEGYHQLYGQAHAEVNAIKKVEEHYTEAASYLRNATLYVNLEPCVHFGKTPPCTDLIIQKKISHVVIGSLDPFDLVNGKGIEKLRQAGIKVTTGIREKECNELNIRFFTYHLKKRPYIILKWAQTADHYFAPEDKKKRWISGEMAKKLVHKWRAEEQSVLVGTHTALTDNPALTARAWNGKNPIRLVIDKDLKLPLDCSLFDKNAPTIVFNDHKNETKENIKWIQIDFHGLVPQFILYQLYLMDIQSVIIEGGAYTLHQFIDYNLWDEARIFTSNDMWQKGIKAPILNGTILSEEKIENDFLTIIQNDQPS